MLAMVVTQDGKVYKSLVKGDPEQFKFPTSITLYPETQPIEFTLPEKFMVYLYMNWFRFKRGRAIYERVNFENKCREFKNEADRYHRKNIAEVR